MTDRIGNQLGRETSPYLLQHADNPVDWLPWSEEALALARKTRKPILLSIGYSACHWCHVMAHESFEDPDTAALMNELFVNIKVDREERPDLDRIYQLAHQMLVQRPGGWPLTMFLTPDEHTPFFGGTYFPPEPRHDMPAFRDLLRRVAEYHARHGDEIAGQSQAIRDVFAKIESAEEPAGALDSAPLAAARAELEATFDRKWGGFGKAPRFPNAPALERLLRHWRASSGEDEPDTQALLICSLTLKRMSEGGIHDQLGGGFCRYAVDDFWMIPHFEKMLYDNAALLPVYAWAGQATGEALFTDTARRTADWMIRVMQSSDGGFFSSLDADSEGEEGKYYVWDPDEIRRALDDEEFAVFSRRFGLDREANFEGRWHLHVFSGIDDVAGTLTLPVQRVSQLLDSATEKLLAIRDRRVRPALDDKVLTAWNGLAIAGLAVAGVVLDEPAHAQAASRAVDFLRDHCVKAGRLKASFRAGQARHSAYLDDYAFLGMGLLRLLEARWRTADLEFAITLADVLLEQFEAPDTGGFYFTAADHELLIHRPRPQSDDATPAGGALASQFLNRLGHLLGETRYLDAAENALAAAAPAMARMASAHASFINALEEHLAPLEIVVIRGGDEARHWQRSLQAIYTPNRMVVAIPEDADDLPGALASRRPMTDTVAYRCVGSTCSPPITSLEELAAPEESVA